LVGIRFWWWYAVQRLPVLGNRGEGRKSIFTAIALAGPARFARWISGCSVLWVSFWLSPSECNVCSARESEELCGVSAQYEGLVGGGTMVDNDFGVREWNRPEGLCASIISNKFPWRLNCIRMITMGITLLFALGCTVGWGICMLGRWMKLSLMMYRAPNVSGCRMMRWMIFVVVFSELCGDILCVVSATVECGNFIRTTA